MGTGLSAWLLMWSLPQRHRLSNRDLSLENILLGAGEECVVIDMGMAIRVPPAPPQQQQQQVLIRSQVGGGKRQAGWLAGSRC